MPRKISATASLLAAFVALGCATTAPYEPYQIPREQFHATVRTIAVFRLMLPDDLENPDRVREKFEAMILTALEREGYRTVPPQQVTPIWEEITTQLGGLFDPMTGARDEEKFDTARLHALQEIATRFGADALLHPSIRVVDAKFDSGTARWCGSTQSMQSTGSSMLEALAGMSTSGTIKATCLFVVVEDMSGVDLYKDMGGIEVLGSLVVGGFEARPQGELFVDGERNQGAVASALGSLARPDVAAAPPTD